MGNIFFLGKLYVWGFKDKRWKRIVSEVFIYNYRTEFELTKFDIVEGENTKKSQVGNHESKSWGNTVFELHFKL